MVLKVPKQLKKYPKLYEIPDDCLCHIMLYLPQLMDIANLVSVNKSIRDIFRDVKNAWVLRNKQIRLERMHTIFAPYWFEFIVHVEVKIAQNWRILFLCLPQMESLRLCGNKLKQTDIFNMTEFLNSGKSLRNLTVTIKNSRKIQKQTNCVSYILRKLYDNTTLQTLNFCEWIIESHGLNLIYRLIQKNNTVNTLKIKINSCNEHELIGYNWRGYLIIYSILTNLLELTKCENLS